MIIFIISVAVFFVSITALVMAAVFYALKLRAHKGGLWRLSK